MTINNLNTLDIELLKENNINSIKKDIVFELYNKNQLNYERLKFIIENRINQWNITSC